MVQTLPYAYLPFVNGKYSAPVDPRRLNVVTPPNPELTGLSSGMHQLSLETNSAWKKR
jgi:hypothetical protein